VSARGSRGRGHTRLSLFSSQGISVKLCTLIALQMLKNLCTIERILRTVNNEGTYQPLYEEDIKDFS
jgi:hypothetical protein